MKLNFLIFEDENSLDETSLIKKKNLLDEPIVLFLSNYSKTQKRYGGTKHFKYNEK